MINHAGSRRDWDHIHKVYMTIFHFRSIDILAQYISYAYVITVSSLLSIVIARFLGPVEFGIYAAALSAGSILGILFDFGFRHLIQRETARPSEQHAALQPKLLATAMAVSLLIAVTMMVVLCLMFPSWRVMILSVGACFASIAITQFISAEMKGRQRFIREGIHVAGARSVSAVLILALLVLGGASSSLILLAWGAGLLLWNLGFNNYAFRRFELAASPSLLPMLISLFLIDLFITVYFRADILLLQYLGAGKAEIGNFSAALRLVEAFIMLGLPLRSIFQTQIRREQLTPSDDIRLFLQRLFVVATVGAVVALVLHAIAEPLTALIYGARFDGAGYYLKALAWMLIPAFMLAVISEVMIAREVEKLYQFLAAAVAVVMVLATVMVQLHYGIRSVVVLKVAMEAVFAVAGFGLILTVLWRRRPA